MRLSALNFESEHRLRSENLAWDIDVWYPRLEKFTFPSIFLPLKLSEAQAIKAYNDLTWRHVKQETAYSERIKYIHTLNKLEREIDEFLASWPLSSNGVFMRLCGRSPKDGEPLHREDVLSDYENALTELLLPNTRVEELDQDPVYVANLKMNAVARVSWLRVRTGKDALSLLLSSERVYAEMIDWLRYGEPEQLCFRAWEPELSVEYEFRLFVHQGRLTAISQYDHYTHYPGLQGREEEVKEGLSNYWRQLHPFVAEPQSSYIADLALLPRTSRYVLVELNPFSPCTGASLFSWSADKALLEGAAEGPVELRLKQRADLHPQLPEAVALNWEQRWLEPREPYWVAYDTIAPGWNNLYRNLSLRLAEAVTTLLSVPTTQVLFVYGTLKTGFHWNRKYLATRLGADYLYPAVSVDPQHLVLGDSGVPYLLRATTSDDLALPLQRVRGEVWRVTVEALRGLDDYEGVHKGYYRRESLMVMPDGNSAEVLAQVYVLTEAEADLLTRPPIAEYTLDMHLQLYKPVVHIQRKQFAYFGRPSGWGKLAQGQTPAGALERPRS